MHNDGSQGYAGIIEGTQYDARIHIEPSVISTEFMLGDAVEILMTLQKERYL